MSVQVLSWPFEEHFDWLVCFHTVFRVARALKHLTRLLKFVFGLTVCESGAEAVVFNKSW